MRFGSLVPRVVRAGPKLKTRGIPSRQSGGGPSQSGASRAGVAEKMPY